MSDEEYLEVDLSNLRIREIEKIEEVTGMAFDTLFAEGKPKAKGLRAVGMIVKQRTNPEFTWEDAGELIVRVPEVTDPPTVAPD